LRRALGEVLTEPKPRVWFAAGADPDPAPAQAGPAWGVRLHPASRMLYDERHVYLNGESYRAAGRDARLMQTLADTGLLDGRQCRRLGASARALLQDWLDAGWLLPQPVPQASEQ